MTRISYRILSSLIAACLLIFTFLGSAMGQESSDAGQLQVSVMPWRVSCAGAANGTGPDCQMSRSMVLADNKALLLRLTVNLSASNPDPSFLLQLPHGIYLPGGVSLSIDDLAPSIETVQACDGAGCYVGLGADRAYLPAFQRGAIFKVSFRNISRNAVVLDFPLDGFANAYAQMDLKRFIARSRRRN